MSLANTTGGQDRMIDRILRTESFEHADELMDVLLDLDNRLTEALDKINELEQEKRELLNELIEARAEFN